MHIPNLATRRALEYAAGYLALGLKAEAREALADIPTSEDDFPPVLEVRGELALADARWSEAAPFFARLCRLQPARAGYWIQQAYAVRRSTGIPAARDVLRAALALHPREPIIHFNLACYAAQSDELAAAREHLDTACGLDPACRALAREDPDLLPLRETGGLG